MELTNEGEKQGRTGGNEGGDDRGVMEGIRERNTVQPKKDNIIIVIDVIEAK